MRETTCQFRRSIMCKKMDVCTCHGFCGENELRQFRAELLSWYASNHRVLPWRSKAEEEEDLNMRGYSVWVSEVMLQQTQVATVIDYYTRWMEELSSSVQKWPSIEELARASPDEVKEVWSGLGYYSRAQRLLEAARKVVGTMGGELPQTAAELEKQLPGVGRYTASAIASIAYGEACGVVDGNVVRVWSRIKTIGASSSSSLARDYFWQLSSEAVDRERPGDFNQALMELGATVCLPQSPLCDSCPVRRYCGAYQQVLTEREKLSLHRYTDGASQSVQPLTASVAASPSDCPLCLPDHLPWKPSLGVANYPRKDKQKKMRQEHFAVGVVEWNVDRDLQRFIIQRRPETGLLAGLWEFPCIAVKPDCPVQKTWPPLQQYLSLQVGKHTFCGTVPHQFSHTLHHYHVWHIVTPSPPPLPTVPPHKWVTGTQLLQSAISTAVRKIYKLVSRLKTEIEVSSDGGSGSERRRGRGEGGGRGKGREDDSHIDQPKKRQKTLDSFLH